MQLYPFSMALTMAVVLDSIADSDEPCGYDAFLSAVSGIDYDVDSDSASEDAEMAMLSFISFLGVNEAQIEDMVLGREEISMDSVASLAAAFKEKYSHEDMIALAEEFASEYQGEPTMDSLSSPKPCGSGYKRKLVIKNGAMAWKCVRLAGKTILSPKQKQALRKARLKSHTALANYSRKRSMKIGKSKGLHK